MTTIKELVDQTNYGIVDRTVGPWTVFGSMIQNPLVCHTLGDARMEILSRSKELKNDFIFRRVGENEIYTNQNGEYLSIKPFSPGQFMTTDQIDTWIKERKI